MPQKLEQSAERFIAFGGGWGVNKLRQCLKFVILTNERTNERTDEEVTFGFLLKITPTDTFHISSGHM